MVVGAPCVYQHRENLWLICKTLMHELIAAQKQAREWYLSMEAIAEGGVNIFIVCCGRLRIIF